MTVTIVIPTYNGRKKVCNLLQSLGKQSFKDFNVVVSIDGSEDDTRDHLSLIKATFPFNLQILDNTHGGRAICRNLGAKAASGDILIFYDDDVRVNPKSVETHYTHHQHHPNSICTGPAYYEMNNLTTDFQKFRAKMEHSWYPKENCQKRKAGMPGANWSIKKDDFFKIGALNERLTDSEDFEFSYRATHVHGFPIFYDLNTWVYHDDYKSLQQYLHRYILGNKSLSKLFEHDDKIKKDYWKKLYIERTRIKGLFFSLFNSESSVKFAESRFFLRLPERIRYKIYDYIITAQTRYFLDENLNSHKKVRS